MFKVQYKDTIYALYEKSPQHRWFFELITQLDQLFFNVNLENAVEKQHAFKALLIRHEPQDLYRRLSSLYTDVMAFVLSDQTLDLPCGPGGVHLYYNNDFTLTLLASDKMPDESGRQFSLAHNSSIYCLDGEMSIQRWEYQSPLINQYWDRQLSTIKLRDEESVLVKPGEFFDTVCWSGLVKVNLQNRFVALSISTKPLLDFQIEFDSNTLTPLRIIDATSDKSQIKVLLKILPMLSQSGCNVDELIELGLASLDHTIRWEAIKASVLAESGIAERALLLGLQDTNDDVRQSCQRLMSQCAV